MGLPVLGKVWETLVDKGGDIIKELVKDKDLSEKLQHEFRQLAQQQAHEMNLKELDAELEMFRAQQTTIQAELHQDDRYTKQTRPKIARQSWYVTMAYGLLTVFGPLIPGVQETHVVGGTIEVISKVPPFSWEVFIAMASPALTYMGVRGFEKWKAGGTPR